MPSDSLRPLTEFVIIELTTRCNLRCVYCALSQPEFHGQDLAFDRAAIVDGLRRAGVSRVQISGHGESTIVSGWHEFSRLLRDAGFAVEVTTNLSKVLAPEELVELSAMRSITMSCDTVDPELFARLRRPAKLERVEENVARLLSRLPPRGEGRPYLAINCTLNDRVVGIEGVQGLVRWASAREFDCVSLVNLVDYPSVDPNFPVRHPADVDPKAAIAEIEAARRLACELDVDFNVMGGLDFRLEEALQR
jgi:molybdenum cofactor biosynthesis enzyme MoaA